MSSPAQPPNAISEISSRSFASLCEIAIAFLLIEAALWTQGPARYGWSMLALAWIVGATIYRKPSFEQLGMTGRGIRSSLWIPGLAVVFSGVCLAVASWTGSLHDYSQGGALAVRAAGYLIWAIEQEFILQSFIFRRLESVLGASKAVTAAALLFTVAHIPSPLLTAGSLLMGWAFCEAFRRYRNIYTLGLAHWLIGLSLSLALPDYIARHMRVGAGYLHFLAH